MRKGCLQLFLLGGGGGGGGGGNFATITRCETKVQGNPSAPLHFTPPNTLKSQGSFLGGIQLNKCLHCIQKSGEHVRQMIISNFRGTLVERSKPI